MEKHLAKRCRYISSGQASHPEASALIETRLVKIERARNVGKFVLFSTALLCFEMRYVCVRLDPARLEEIQLVSLGEFKASKCRDVTRGPRLLYFRPFTRIRVTG